MEVINTEALVSSLLVMGFDKIDSLLYVYTLGQLTIDNTKTKDFSFQDQEISPDFEKYIEFDGSVYRLKEGYTLDTNISPINGHTYTLRDRFQSHKKLLEYLSTVDFKSIVLKKANNMLAPEKEFFCDKELELVPELFSPKYKLMNKEGKIEYSTIPGTLGGNRKLKIYGRLDCRSANRWLKKGYYKNERVFFADEETAIAAGYRPCAVCMRKKYNEWKQKAKTTLQ